MTLTALRARTLVFRELDLIRGVEIAPEPVGRRAAGDRQPSTLGRGRRRLAQDLELLIGRPCRTSSAWVPRGRDPTLHPAAFRQHVEHRSIAPHDGRVDRRTTEATTKPLTPPTRASSRTSTHRPGAGSWRPRPRRWRPGRLRGPPPSIRTAAIANSTTTAIEIAPGAEPQGQRRRPRSPGRRRGSHLDGPAQPLVSRQPEGEHGGHRGEKGSEWPSSSVATSQAAAAAIAVWARAEPRRQ